MAKRFLIYKSSISIIKININEIKVLSLAVHRTLSIYISEQNIEDINVFVYRGDITDGGIELDANTALELCSLFCIKLENAYTSILTSGYCTPMFSLCCYFGAVLEK